MWYSPVRQLCIDIQNTHPCLYPSLYLTTRCQKGLMKFLSKGQRRDGGKINQQNTHRLLPTDGIWRGRKCVSQIAQDTI